MACKSSTLIVTAGLGLLAASSAALFLGVLLPRRGFSPSAKNSGWLVAVAGASGSPRDAFVLQRLYDILDDI